MSYDYNFPDVGEGITEGKLVKWLVKEGDAIKTDMPLAEIETDKSIVQVPSPTNGTVEKLFYKEGDVIPVKKPMMRINNDGTNPIPQQSPTTKAEEPPRNIISQPTQNKNNISNTDSSILALPSVRNAAKQRGIDLAKITGTGKDGRITMQDLETQTGQKDSSKQKPAIATSTPSQQSPKDILATPSTRILARELGVDILNVTPTGVNGIITREDIMNAAGKSQGKDEATQKTTVETSAYKPSLENFGGMVERVPLSQMRKAISRNMVTARDMTVPYTVFDEIDVTEIVKIRDKEKKRYEKKGIKLTYLPFFVKAVSTALSRHPTLNSSLDDSKQELIVKKYYNIGIATDTPEGLMVPVVKEADRKSIVEIGKEINELAEKARSRKIRPDEMRDSTFTITSIGNIAGQYFTQMINYPNTAILGIGKITEKPVVIKGRIRSRIATRKMLPLSLTSDHRIIDGAEASRFLKTMDELLSDIDSLLLEME